MTIIPALIRRSPDNVVAPILGCLLLFLFEMRVNVWRIRLGPMCDRRVHACADLRAPPAGWVGGRRARMRDGLCAADRSLKRRRCQGNTHAERRGPTFLECPPFLLAGDAKITPLRISSAGFLMCRCWNRNLKSEREENYQNQYRTRKKRRPPTGKPRVFLIAFSSIRSLPSPEARLLHAFRRGCAHYTVRVKPAAACSVSLISIGFYCLLAVCGASRRKAYYHCAWDGSWEGLLCGSARCSHNDAKTRIPIESTLISFSKIRYAGCNGRRAA